MTKIFYKNKFSIKNIYCEIWFSVKNHNHENQNCHENQRSRKSKLIFLTFDLKRKKHEVLNIERLKILSKFRCDKLQFTWKKGSRYGGNTQILILIFPRGKVRALTRLLRLHNTCFIYYQVRFSIDKSKRFSNGKQRFLRSTFVKI